MIQFWKMKHRSIYGCLLGERESLRETFAFLIKKEDVTSMTISLSSYLEYECDS